MRRPAPGSWIAGWRALVAATVLTGCVNGSLPHCDRPDVGVVLIDVEPLDTEPDEGALATEAGRWFPEGRLVGPAFPEQDGQDGYRLGPSGFEYEGPFVYFDHLDAR